MKIRRLSEWYEDALVMAYEEQAQRRQEMQDTYISLGLSLGILTRK